MRRKPPSSRLIRSDGQTLEHCRVGRAGGHGIDLNTVSGCLEGGGLRNTLDRVLASGVEREVRGSALAHRRGYVDDAAAALRLHDPQFVLQTEQGAEDVGIEHPGKGDRGGSADTGQGASNQDNGSAHGRRDGSFSRKRRCKMALLPLYYFSSIKIG
jgi:hypothetical protein